MDVGFLVVHQRREEDSNDSQETPVEPSRIFCFPDRRVSRRWESLLGRNSGGRLTSREGVACTPDTGAGA